MRADIHDGREHMLQSEAGYIDARPHHQDRQNLLHRTAGPYKRVKTRIYRTATATAGSPQLADIPASRCRVHDRTAACLSPCARPDFPPPPTRINRTTSFVRTARR